MREADRIKDQIVLMDTLAERARTEPSPHQQNIATWERKRLEAQNSFNNIKKRLDGFDIIIRHLTYIFSAYNDKQKLKSALLGDLVPFLNERVSYYLGALGCEFDLAFDATLKDTTTKWDYEFCSGGERKRIDLAVMFAFYDLYVAIYGPQCNVIVLDEVDGRLDPIGVEAFVSVIERDFTKKGAATGTHKPDAVLVISHKDEMRDAFPSKIKIVKDGGYSRIAEVRR
jgi:DNA repair exonuclease SbcCD ATPase subunit